MLDSSRFIQWRTSSLSLCQYAIINAAASLTGETESMQSWNEMWKGGWERFQMTNFMQLTWLGLPLRISIQSLKVPELILRPQVTVHLDCWDDVAKGSWLTVPLVKDGFNPPRLPHLQRSILRQHVMTWYDVTWHFMTWHDDLTWHFMTWHDLALMQRHSTCGMMGVFMILDSWRGCTSSVFESQPIYRPASLHFVVPG